MIQVLDKVLSVFDRDGVLRVVSVAFARASCNPEPEAWNLERFAGYHLSTGARG